MLAFNLEQSGEAHFRQYGKTFQEKIFQGLITDKQWAQQMVEVMEPHFFDVKYLQYLSDRYFKYFEKYRCFPTMQLLIGIIRDELGSEDVILRQQIVEFLQRVRSNPHPGDIKYVKERILDFCKRQAFKEALEKAVDLVQGDQFESVIDLMKEAVSVGMPSSIGHEFFEDFESRFLDIHRSTCPTGIKELDERTVFDGGLGRGELGVIVAPTGVGKSHWLVAMGCEAMKAGKTVVHYTLELSETLTGKRYDANLSGIPVNDLIENKDKVHEYYKNNELGKLIIKEYPMRSASVVTLRNHLEKLKLKGYTPSLVLIDYADIMRSTKSYDSLRHELQLIYEELRQTSKEYNVPIWTASQSNREGSSQEYVGLHNMSEAYGKAMTADVVVTISRKPEEKASGAARLFVAKNRAGKDGLLFPIHIDTARSRFRIMSEDEVMELNPEKKLKKVWNDLKEIKKDTLA